MKIKRKTIGFSLTEMVVVVAILALLTGFGLPAIRSLHKSFESGSGIKASIDAAFSTARAIAAREQRYAGVRFQLDLHGNQYMIFIIHDPEKTGLSNGFRALDGQKPMKLPDDVRIIDMVHRWAENPSELRDVSIGFFSEASKLEDYDIADSVDGQITIIRDTSCFSVIFSPTGRLTMHEVRVRNRDGIYKPDNSVPGKESMDEIFNSLENILNFNVGMFPQDDDSEFGGSFGGEPGSLFGGGSLGAEYSRNKIYIYDKPYFDKLGDSEDRLEYLKSLEPVFINQYTGTIVNNK